MGYTLTLLFSYDMKKCIFIIKMKWPVVIVIHFVTKDYCS